MKILVISDIHGNASALRDALRVFARIGATRILIAGDHLGGRPFSRDTDEGATAVLLKAYADKITSVRGNCDTAFDERRTGLSLPPYVCIAVEGKTVFMTHGHVYREGRLPALDNKPDYVITGHTHVPSLSRADGVVYLNPGSIACPRGGADCTYAVITDDAVSIYRLTDDGLLAETSV